MALYKVIECKDDVKIGVWSIEETLESLLSLYPNDIELQKLAESKINKQRLTEKVAVRVLLHRLLPDLPVVITYESSGKPILNEGEFNISISHTKGFVAVLVAPGNMQVGVDIEPVSERTVRVAKRFMGVDEYNMLMQDNDKTVATVCWSAKEALYKAFGSALADFRKSIRVLPFTVAEEGFLYAETLAAEKQCCRLNYFLFDDTALVWFYS